MQIYALDQDLLIRVSEAKKEKTYTCPECGSPLKKRGGAAKQPHFYHVRRPHFCRQHAKSEEHLALQLHLQQHIGSDRAVIERPFPSLQRIADVAWLDQHSVFEIQCSPLSLEEAQMRTSDYEKAGYRVFWILHDKTFNRASLSAAEQFLRQRGCYFTNFNKIGQGIIYDQFEVLCSHKRTFKGPPLPCDPTQLISLPTPFPHNLPSCAQQRVQTTGLCIAGDLLHRLLLDPPSSRRLASLEEKLSPPQRRDPRLPLRTLLAKVYLSLLQLLLRAVS